MRYKTPDDCEPVINVVSYYPLLVVKPDAPWRNVQAVVKHIHDAARAVLDEPAFNAAMDLRGADVDYRPGDQLRADLWREYKLHTDILKRIGMIK